MDYIWYAGYGSNLSEQRFLCYIQGGSPHFGRKCNTGCEDTTLPVENKPKIIHYRLYFALPDNCKKTCNWGCGGIAFISPHKDKMSKTLCRMWKITKNQYEEVKKQEGRSYNKEIKLGEDNGVPIYTITNKNDLRNILCPSDCYIKTIALGIKEAYNFDVGKIASYLITKDGISGNLQKDQILKLITPIKNA